MMSARGWFLWFVIWVLAGGSLGALFGLAMGQLGGAAWGALVGAAVVSGASALALALERRAPLG